MLIFWTYIQNILTTEIKSLTDCGLPELKTEQEFVYSIS